MRRLWNKKGQSTAEYAIVIGLVVAAAIAMQTYVKRGIQGRSKDAVDTFATSAEHNGVDFGLGTAVDYSFTAGKDAQVGPANYLESRTVTSTIGSGTKETESIGEGGKATRDSTRIQTQEVDEHYTYDY